jgi:uncharacterized protein (DUF2141 family)
MNWSIPFGFALAGAAPLLVAATEPAPPTIYVTVKNVTLAKGGLYVSLCRKAEFMTANCYKTEGQKVTKAGDHTFTFKNSEPGVYAVMVVHDINGNGKVDRNAYGAPAEPTGVSGRAPVAGQLPSFDTSSFRVGQKPIRITVSLI